MDSISYNLYSNGDMPAHIAERLYPEIDSSSPEILSVNEEITDKLVNSLDQYVHAVDYAEKAAACCARLGPQYNSLRSFCSHQRAHVVSLHTAALRKLARMNLCEKKMVLLVFLGICLDDWGVELWDEFLHLKEKWNYMMDQLENLQAQMKEEEAILEMALHQLGSWLDQLDEWENNRQTAVEAGEECLEEVRELWYERNVWLAQNGLAPTDGGL
ncbi:hypothetical protein E8E11_010101 [Didymella keratinophila]|nr:hypothetical protein E8E11_010101 [Didymella keratinophila]